MKRSTVYGLAAVLALLMLPACANPADDVPAAKVAEEEEHTGQGAQAEQAGGVEGEVYTIGEGSSVGFVGSKITGSHDGGFRGFEGWINLVDGDPGRSQVEIEIDTTTLWADNEDLAGHLKSPDFFDVENFPTATFTSRRIVPEGTGYVIVGELDLHGITKEISFPAQITVEPDRVTARTEFSIKRFDFDIVYPGKPDDLIRDEVVVKLDIVAHPSEG